MKDAQKDGRMDGRRQTSGTDLHLAIKKAESEHLSRLCCLVVVKRAPRLPRCLKMSHHGLQCRKKQMAGSNPTLTWVRKEVKACIFLTIPECQVLTSSSLAQLTNRKCCYSYSNVAMIITRRQPQGLLSMAGKVRGAPVDLLVFKEW